ncbi:MAG: STY4199 family HEPN domain-containing protein, partial [Myxococcota bacterium]|nr:STY4199 family HEPN domain-containing protein [Myxococcota bacterium]
MSIQESAHSAAAAIAARVSEDANADSLTTLEAAVKAYSDAKGRIGKAGAAERLGLKEQELVFFEKVFREAGRRSNGEPEGVDARQRDIACLRLISWAETINSRNDDWQIPVDLGGDPSEERARAQVRAVELLLRALITESYKSQDALVERLGGLFKASVVDKWKKSGDKGDILSGTLFSELASLFVNKQEFG